MNKILIALGLVFLSMSVQAAEWQCFRFSKMKVTTKEPFEVPAIEVFRETDESGNVFVFRQEIIALNEEVDDLLKSKNDGDEVCLKGRKGHTTVYKFMAYDAK